MVYYPEYFLEEKVALRPRGNFALDITNVIMSIILIVTLVIDVLK